MGDGGATHSWDLIRALLALHRAGSFEGAAQSLGVDVSTLRRRIQALERDVGVVLFTRRDGQLVLVEQEGALLQAALQMEGAYGQFVASSNQARVGGSVRLSTLDIFAGLLAPDLARLRRGHPEVQVELTTEPHFVDLERERIDLAIRLARPLRGINGLKRLATVHFGVYGAETSPDQDLLALFPHHGRMDHEFQLADERWHQEFRCRAVVARADGYPTLLRLCQEGMGLAMLPCFLADASSGLRRVPTNGRALQIGLWAVIRQDVSHLPKVRMLMAFLTETFNAYKPVLAGRGS